MKFIVQSGGNKLDTADLFRTLAPAIKLPPTDGYKYRIEIKLRNLHDLLVMQKVLGHDLILDIVRENGVPTITVYDAYLE